MKKLSLMAALLLAGCSSGDSNNPFPPTPEPTTDAFYAVVLALVAGSPDDAEPGSIDNVASTAPEDSEPLPQ
jgi:hypothetical protein